jgi:AmmeMemoRadiSam system protein B
MTKGTWLMPGGPVDIDTALACAICRGNDLVEDDPLAHRHEHSLEVQIPFLRARNPRLRIVPITLSRLSLNECLELGGIVARAVKGHGGPVLIVASSDMSHYEPREQAAAKDQLAIDRILALDPRGLLTTVVENRITMCGVIPVTAAMAAALELGAEKAELVRYTDSGETSGDTERVVGYAGVVIS